MATALLIIDMQNHFLPMFSIFPECVPNVLNLITHFQSHSLPVFLTQHGHPPEDLVPPYRNQLVKKWGLCGSIQTGSHDWELIQELAAISLGVPIVAKNTYDAFLGVEVRDPEYEPKLGPSGLERLLREKKIKRIVVTGVMTDCCVDTTARSAFNRGWEVWVVRNATASANRRQHEAGLTAFGFAFGEVVDIKEVLQKLSGGEL